MPATPIATSVVPWRHGRPNESLTITPTSDPVSSRSRARSRRADASGSTGSSTTVPAARRVRGVDAGRCADEAVAGLGDHERRPRAHDRVASRRITSTWRGSPSSPASSRARGRRLDVVERTTRPSTFETAFCATTTTSPSSSRDALGDRAAGQVVALARSPGRPSTRWTDLAGVTGRRSTRSSRRAPVAPVQVDDHRRQAFERTRARERAGVERAAGDERRRELERELLRARVVTADERVLVGRLVAPRFAAAIEWRPATTGASTAVLDPLGERARVRRRARRRPSRSASSLADREERRRRRAHRRAPGRCRAARVGLHREHDEVGVRDGVVVRRRPRLPELLRRRARPLRVARADHDLVARPRAGRTATAGAERCPCRRGSRLSTGDGSEDGLGEPPRRRVVVAHQRPRRRPGARRPILGCVGLVDDERVDQARVAARHMRRGRAARQAARASGRRAR